MKNIIIKLSITLIACVVTSIYININRNDPSETDLFISNIEALASDEQSDNDDIQYCRCKNNASGVKTCQDGHKYSVRPACHKAPKKSKHKCNDYNDNCH